MSFLVVFDTCTHARYYGDVHQVLSLPSGAVIRYEYKRKLFKSDAARTIEHLICHPNLLPVPALLMYGEKRGFVHGANEPTTMLTQADSVFIPTRSAYLVAVAIEEAGVSSEDVLYMHFQLRGFVSPDTPVVGTLISALEAADSLPFGHPQQQYTWISLLPSSLTAQENQLVSDEQTPWTKVVEKFVVTPTQFEKDVFWRVRNLVEIKGGQPRSAISLVDRRTNLRVHTDSWFRDYHVIEGERYAVALQTYSPDGHGTDVPAGSSIAMTSQDDDQALLKLAADPLEIVPNQIEYKRFSISTDGSIFTRYAGIRLETQVAGYSSSYPPGSLCSLTFSIRKSRWRLILGISLLLGGAILGIYVAAAKPDVLWSVILSTIAGGCGVIGGWLITRQFKFGK